MANDFSGDANCKAVFNVDDGALTVDSKGTNTLTNSGMTADTGTFKQGDASALSDNINDQLFILDGDLDAGFPLKNGDSNKKISVCFWFRSTGFPGSGFRYILGKFEIGTRSFAMLTSTAEPQLFIGFNNGDSQEAVPFGTSMVANRWYHFGVTFQDSDKSFKMRIWDDNASALLGGAEVTGNTTNNINVENAQWHIGSATSINNSAGMQIDEIVVFNDILTSGEIDQIRAGTYSAGSTTSTAAASTTTTTTSTTTTASTSTTSSTTTTSTTSSTTSSTSSTASTTSSTSSTASTSSTSSTASTTSSTSSTASTTSTASSTSSSSSSTSTSTSSTTSSTTSSSTTTTAIPLPDSEVWTNWLNGKTLYFCRFTVNGNVFLTNGSSDEKWGTGGRDAADYAVPMPESSISGHYVGPFDEDGNIGEGQYRIGIFEQTGINPADSDKPAIFQGELFWDGAQEITLGIINNGNSSPVVREDEAEPILVDPDSGDVQPGGGAGSSPGGGAEGGGGSVISGGSSGC